MHVLDMDTLRFWQAGDLRVLRSWKKRGEPEIGITIITSAEVLRGRIEHLLKADDKAELLRAQELLGRTQESLSRMVVVPLDARSCAMFERLRETKGCRKIGRADLLIASIVLVHDAILVTRNLRHFKPIPNLHVENWVD